MPTSKHKPSTSGSGDPTSEVLSKELPTQEDFRQYLRRLAVSAVQVLIEQVMREELEAYIPRDAQRDVYCFGSSTLAGFLSRVPISHA